MELISKYLEAGTVYKNNDQVLELRINKFSNIINKISPFFEKAPIQGVKQLDYFDFCKIGNLMIEGKHFDNRRFRFNLYNKIKNEYWKKILKCLIAR